ncbi:MULTISPECIES: 3-oxoacyl-ACP synthase [unclassified Rhizobacter]|uniref:3-oxoacyl-ACP synthase n=1 Tax=unclassified Rhizobacter TaxID=2640088 RepID=UPI0006FB66FB|nr:MULTISPECIES: 3-oxoacyl-ACP synthase [unclassified Rhizobacter]KQV98734.1 3-oxoacyl-ACP synthase [Rhizobacter sp. Root1238]KRB04943.1 3-oxoacyl-ACP synthase [Rhizobacter sp. Root16D2]
MTSIAIRQTGLVTSVGLTASTACAAIRAKISNPGVTRFIDPAGRPIAAHEVSLDKPWRGLHRLARMAAMAIEECLVGLGPEEKARVPLLLCVAERERPGREDGLDDRLFGEIQELLSTRFAANSAVVAHGRVGTAVALASAHGMLQDPQCPGVIVAGVDSLLSWPTLSAMEQGDRLLTDTNSNGFLPGEAAGAVLLGRAGSARAELRCLGVGFGVEKAHVNSEEPLRADGLATAIKQALVDAGREMHDMDFRITDVSGEQYYFKEAALALSRTLRRRKEAFDIWHPAECIGETGSASGLAVLCVAEAACRKGYTLGPNIVTHFGNDAGQRAAAILHYAEAL